MDSLSIKDRLGMETEAGEQAIEPLAYNTQQTCQLLGGISTVTLWRLEKRGLIRSVPFLRTKLYPRKEIERFLSKLEVA